MKVLFEKKQKKLTLPNFSKNKLINLKTDLSSLEEMWYAFLGRGFRVFSGITSSSALTLKSFHSCGFNSTSNFHVRLVLICIITPVVRGSGSYKLAHAEFLCVNEIRK